MQADEVDMLALLQHFDELVELMLRDSELVFIQTCCHILVSVCIDVWVDAH